VTIGVIDHNKYLAEDEIKARNLTDAIVILKTVKSIARHASQVDKIYIHLSDSELKPALLEAVKDAVGEQNVYRIESKFNEADWRKPIKLPPRPLSKGKENNGA
jgi:hypothetical protein